MANAALRDQTGGHTSPAVACPASDRQRASCDRSRYDRPGGPRWRQRLVAAPRCRRTGCPCSRVPRARRAPPHAAHTHGPSFV